MWSSWSNSDWRQVTMLFHLNWQRMLKKQYLVLFLGAVIVRLKSRKRHHGRMNRRDVQSGRWEQSRKVSRHCWWISRAPVRSFFPAEWLRCFISCVSWWRCRTSGGVAMPARKQRCIGDCILQWLATSYQGMDHGLPNLLTQPNVLAQQVGWQMWQD